MTIELRWVQITYSRPVPPQERVLQWRERLGAVTMAPGARPTGAGLASSPDEGWTPWRDVPIVTEMAEMAQPQLMPPPAEEKAQAEEDEDGAE